MRRKEASMSYETAMIKQLCPNEDVDAKMRVAERFAEMERSNWAALQAMDYGELQAIEAEAGRSIISAESVDSEHAQQIHRTIEAIKGERLRRDMQANNNWMEQNNRAALVKKAPRLVREAVQLCEWAQGIKRNAEPIPSTEPAPDIAGMDEGELYDLLCAYRAELQQIGRMPELLQDDADALKALKGKAAQATAKELAQDAASWAARVESLRECALAVEARMKELEAERVERQAKERETRENLPEIIAELQARIVDLEAAKER